MAALSPARRWVLRIGLVLCAATTAAWVASYRWSLWYWRPGYPTVLVGKGYLRYGGLTRTPEGVPPPLGWRVGPPAIMEEGWIPIIFPGVCHVPFWCMLLGVGVLMARARWGGLPLDDPGACHACGYDFKGLSEGTHCPECGTPRLALA